MQRQRSVPKLAGQAAARRGSATVEFAVLSPIFLALVMTAAQSAFNIDTAHSLYAAIRQAGRLASLDSSEFRQQGQTANQKVIADIKNQLTAEGLPGDQMTVTITEADSSTEFDLSNPDNDLRLFRISVEVPYSAMNSIGTFSTSSMEKFNASIVFRKGRNNLVN